MTDFLRKIDTATLNSVNPANSNYILQDVQFQKRSQNINLAQLIFKQTTKLDGRLSWRMVLAEGHTLPVLNNTKHTSHFARSTGEGKTTFWRCCTRERRHDEYSQRQEYIQMNASWNAKSIKGIIYPRSREKLIQLQTKVNTLYLDTR